MKKILFLLTALVILVACDIKPTIAESGKIDCTEGYQIQQSNELGEHLLTRIYVSYLNEKQGIHLMRH